MGSSPNKEIVPTTQNDQQLSVYDPNLDKADKLADVRSNQFKPLQTESKLKIIQNCA
jgi:hypothetical protein